MASIESSEYLKLVRSDFHGANLKIISSTIEPLIDLQGIVVKESLKTFTLVTPKDKVVVVVKEKCVFEFWIGERKFEILGAGIVYRSDERIRITPKIRNYLPKLGGLLEVDGWRKRREEKIR